MRTALALALLVSGFAAAGCVTGAGPAGGGGPANVPHLSLRDVDGRDHYLTDYIGRKTTVMAFWATWCMPCRQELAVLQDLYVEHAREGLEVLAINVDGPETMGRVRPFVKQSGWTFPVLLDTETRVTSLYNPRKQMPTLHIFNVDGRIVYTKTTFQAGHGPALKKKVRQVLRADREG
jgi:peroxiredoxin